MMSTHTIPTQSEDQTQQDEARKASTGTVRPGCPGHGGSRVTTASTALKEVACTAWAGGKYCIFSRHQPHLWACTFVPALHAHHAHLHANLILSYTSDVAFSTPSLNKPPCSRDHARATLRSLLRLLHRCQDCNLFAYSQQDPRCQQSFWTCGECSVVCAGLRRGVGGARVRLLPPLPSCVPRGVACLACDCVACV